MGRLEIPPLMFATLAVAVVISLILIVRLRSKLGKHPMSHQGERNMSEIERGDPPADPT